MAAHAISFAPESSLIASLSISTASHAIAFSPVSSLSGVLSLGVTSSLVIAFNPVSSLDATLALSGSNAVAVAFGPVSSLNATLNLAVAKTNSIEFLPVSTFNGNLSLAGVSTGMTLCELVKESLSLWGFLCSKNAPQYALDRAITDINTAMQLVWNNAEGKDYWSSETLTITLADGESASTLSDAVQNVTGPLRRSDNSRPLTPLKTIGELETFIDLYLNGETTDEPLAYHVERMKQSSDDPAKCVLNVVPAVSGASVSFLLDVVKECPRYTVSDLSTCPLVPIPHQYAETLLIPIIRYNASSYFLFAAADPTQKETIDREYKQSMVSLGLADPNPAKTKERSEA